MYMYTYINIYIYTCTFLRVLIEIYHFCDSRSDLLIFPFLSIHAKMFFYQYTQKCESQKSTGTFLGVLTEIYTGTFLRVLRFL